MTATETEYADADVIEPDIAPAEEQAPEETPADEAPAEAEVVEPADLAKPEGVVEIRSPHGHLTLRPDQSVSNLDSEQQAGLIAIGIDVKKDPGVWPHLRAFIHMCQLRRLDPYAKEAYLIGRGTGDYRKWTMQTSIDGYRKMSASTGRFIRVKARLWTGQDDDEKSWRMVEEDGVMVMKRVWFDQWPESRGYPGSAMVIIEHYDEQGNITTTAATADWKFYAPYTPKYTGYGKNRKKVLDEAGHEILELSEMWEKGYSHMLSKCCEALCHRMAFPNTVNGFYVAEEMHRLDQIERDRQASAQRAAIGTAYADAQQRALPSETSSEPARAGQPVSLGESARETVENLRANTRAPRGDSRAPKSALGNTGARVEVPDTERAAHLRAEIEMLAELFARTPGELLARQAVALGKEPSAFTVDELLASVLPLRDPGAAKMRAVGRGSEAAAYETVPQGAIMPLSVLLGWQAAGEETAVDPRAPHSYVDNGGVCAVEGCDRFGDDPIHSA